MRDPMAVPGNDTYYFSDRCHGFETDFDSHVLFGDHTHWFGNAIDWAGCIGAEEARLSDVFLARLQPKAGTNSILEAVLRRWFDRSLVP